MRWLLIGVSVAALTACGPRQKREASSAPNEPAVMADTMTPPGIVASRAPGIDVTAAPGVAFTYRYGFRLPSDHIAAVQEQHAQACERLGLARCRITGMRYRLLGENNVEGELDFKLAPELARRFGSDGIASVERAGGTRVDTEITGTDAGATIDRAAIDRARAEDERRRLDALLARAKTGAERAQLQAQREEAGRRLAAAADTTADARASLATTPVTFLYGSGPAVRGFDSSAPITSALDTAIGSAQVTLAVVLALLAILGPPALVIGLVVLLVLRLRRRRRVAVETPAS